MKRRATTHLTAKLERNLLAYATAAGAAGISVLAFTQPAQGKVVYTPVHVLLGHGGISSFDIDLNHDGVADFRLLAFYNGCTTECTAGMFAQVMNGGEGVEDNQSTSHYPVSALALRPMAKIGPHAQFSPGKGLGILMVDILSFPSNGSRQVFGKWNNVKNRYLGLKFSINGEVHFGWARLHVRDHQHYIKAILTGYAYETKASKPIVAGDTGASLGSLALGAADAKSQPPVTKAH